MMIMEEEELSLLQKAQKIIMLRNGGFEFDSFKEGSCCCNHSRSDHLDYIDCCLAKSKELCICDRFLEKGSKIRIATKQDAKLPKKIEQKQKPEVYNYIETLARM